MVKIKKLLIIKLRIELLEGHQYTEKKDFLEQEIFCIMNERQKFSQDLSTQEIFSYREKALYRSKKIVVFNL